jgi:DNA-binding NarL/FixJ family response regulator
MLLPRAVTVVMRTQTPIWANRMIQPTALPLKSPILSAERMRILLFACSPTDAQKALMQGDGVEVAYLPSYDAQEILNEISRFSPRLIACRSDFFIAALQASSELRLPSSEHQFAATLPNGAMVSTISPREAKILSLLVQGKTNNEIAR